MKRRRTANIGASSGDFGETPWAEWSIDKIQGLKAPTNDHDAYFRFRNPPEEWEQASTDFSQAPLFFHTVKKESLSPELLKYRQRRARMKGMTDDRRIPRAVRKMLTSFMLNRPVFAITELTSRTGIYHSWNAWDEKILRDHYKIAKEANVHANTLWFVYSSESMATSEFAGANVDELKDKLIASWYKWLATENKEFEEVLGFVDEWLKTTYPKK